MFIAEQFLQLIDLEESMEYPKISDNPAIQAHYEYCRAQGTSHALAEMFACETPPDSRTDREFLMSIRQGRDSQFSSSSWRGNYYKEKAESLGANVKGAEYMPGLARFPGDPEAWVWGLGDVQKRVEERGWSCEGRLSIKARELENPPEKAEPAADIVYDRCLQRIDENPDLQAVADAKPREFFEETREMLKPRWDNVYQTD